jgi:hypothetical protein
MLVVPELMMRRPDTPLVPALDVAILIEPDDDNVLGPDEI